MSFRTIEIPLFRSILIKKENEVTIVSGPTQKILENVLEMFDLLCDVIDLTNSTLSVAVRNSI